MVFVIRFNDKRKTHLETDTPEDQSKVMNTSLLYTGCNTCSYRIAQQADMITFIPKST